MNAASYQKSEESTNQSIVDLLQEYANQLGNPTNNTLLKNHPSLLEAVGAFIGKHVDKGVNKLLPARDTLFIKELKNSPEYKRFIDYYQNKYSSNATKKREYSFFDSGAQKSAVLESLYKSLRKAKTQETVHQCLNDYFSNEPKKAHAQETLSRPQGINLKSILCWLGLKSTTSHSLMENLYIKAAEIGQKYAAIPAHSNMNDYLFCSEFGAIKAYVDNQVPINNAKVSVLKRFLSKAEKSDSYQSLSKLVIEYIDNQKLQEQRSYIHNPLSGTKSIQLLTEFQQAIDDIHAQKSNVHKYN